MKCPFCSARVSEIDTICPECGKSIAGSEDETVMISVEGATSASKGRAPTEVDPTTIGGPGAEPEGTSGWSLPEDSGGSADERGTGHLGPGSRLGARYEILQMLGEGGMGAVYKARDVELDRLVALKVIRPELAKDPEILKRFKQEIILSREVTHRNVVRIFDLGQAEGIRFISMEFIEGRDLQGILKEESRVPVNRAVEIIEQVCLALEEAHEAGVVHRDLKPSNIMIDKDGRIVVMDFGIARSMQITGVTQTGSVLGTPDYMSPEQIKGEHVDSRSDIFALGVIFFQLLTGEVPYPGDSPMAAMYMRTQKKARSVREVEAQVPGFVDDVIGRCLEISPQRRYQSARELVHDLEMWRGGTPGTMSMTLRHLRAAPRRLGNKVAWALGVASLLAVLVVAVVFLRQSAPETAIATSIASEEVTSLAILPFGNASGAEEVEWLSTGLPDMLLTDVGQSAALRTVSSERLFEVRKDLGLLSKIDLESSDRKRLAEISNAQVLVWGRYIKVGDQIRIDATVEDVTQGVQTPIKVEAAGESELLDAVERLAGLVRENLALSSQRVEELEGQAFRPSSSSVAAVRHYLQGRELMRQGSNLEAVVEFESSIAVDPEFALAYSELGEAKSILGHGREAVEASSKAVALSEGLLPQERNLILAQDARITNDLEAGVTAYESLLRMRPSDPDLHFELGALYENEGLYDRAREQYAQALVADPQNLSALLAAGRALALQGDAVSALDPLTRSLNLAVQLGNRELEANALHGLGLAYDTLDRLDEAKESFQKSRGIKDELGDRRGEAASLGQLAAIHASLADWDAAEAAYLETIELAREIGDSRGESISLMNLGEMERNRGNYEGALQLTRQALRIQIENQDELNQGLALNNIGATYHLQGKYDDALVYYERSLEIRERLDLPTEIADTIHNIGDILSTTGQLEKALDKYLEALELRRQHDDRWGEALESYYMGKVFSVQGRYRAALEAIEEANRVFDEIAEDSVWSAEAQAWRGKVLALLGRVEEAQGPIASALEKAEAWEDSWLRSVALDFEGERLYYSGDVAAARRTFENSLAAAEEVGDPFLVLTSQVDAARADIALRQERAAVDALTSVVERAGKLGLKVLENEAKIHLGAALLEEGEPDRALELLTTAIREGQSLGAAAAELTARIHLAATLMAIGDRAGAVEQREAAVALLERMERESGSRSIRQRADLADFGPAVD